MYSQIKMFKKIFVFLFIFIVGYILGNMHPTQALAGEQETSIFDDQEMVAFDNNSSIELESL